MMRNDLLPTREVELGTPAFVLGELVLLACAGRQRNLLARERGEALGGLVALAVTAVVLGSVVRARHTVVVDRHAFLLVQGGDGVTLAEAAEVIEPDALKGEFPAALVADVLLVQRLGRKAGTGADLVEGRLVADWKALEPNDARLDASIIDVKDFSGTYKFGGDSNIQESGYYQTKTMPVIAWGETEDGGKYFKSFSNVMYDLTWSSGNEDNFQLNSVNDMVLIRSPKSC